jgi:hypothetical protein
MSATWSGPRRRLAGLEIGVQLPPIHIPFFFEAAILSRMHSPVTSRSTGLLGDETPRR